MTEPESSNSVPWPKKAADITVTLHCHTVTIQQRYLTVQSKSASQRGGDPTDEEECYR